MPGPRQRHIQEIQPLAPHTGIFLVLEPPITGGLQLPEFPTEQKMLLYPAPPHLPLAKSFHCVIQHGQQHILVLQPLRSMDRLDQQVRGAAIRGRIALGPGPLAIQLREGR